MRSLFLWTVLGITALGLVATLPSQASARPPRWGGWRGGYRPSWGGRYWYGRRAVYYPYAASFYPGYAMYYPPYAYYPPADYWAGASLSSVPDSQFSSFGSAQAELPHPTGGAPVAPSDAGVIQLRVPDKFAQVSFDGQSTSSIGTTREYITPILQAGKTYHYTITATWDQGDQQKTMQRTVDIGRGQIRTVDFTAVPKATTN
jgi:uncharacterized protein (TIGR03000 family)